MKIVVITGLTATGKSELALELAKKYNGEIISADSVQLYCGLDIGSAKESERNRKNVKHHLIDIKDFRENYNVGQFLIDCDNAIKDIASRGKLPIIVGGTGLYIKALLCGYDLGGADSDPEFRILWQNIAKEKGNDYVWNELNKLNPEKAKTVHKNNLKRVIRYLELESKNVEKLEDKTTGKSDIEKSNANKDSKFNEFTNNLECKIPKDSKEKHNKFEFFNILSNNDVCAVGIVEDRDTLYTKINARVDKMMSLGLKNEVSKLINLGATSQLQSMNSIGYREWFDYFDKKQSEERTVELIKQHSRNYCKRQLTFLKTIPNLKLCEKKEAKYIIEEFLDDRD